MALFGKSETVTLQVDGMTCGGCAKNVEKAALSVPGVKKADVDHAAGTATVTHKGADVQALVTKISDAGYPTQA